MAVWDMAKLAPKTNGKRNGLFNNPDRTIDKSHLSIKVRSKYLTPYARIKIQMNKNFKSKSKE